MSVKLVWRVRVGGMCGAGVTGIHPCLSCWVQEHCTAFSHLFEVISTPWKDES